MNKRCIALAALAAFAAIAPAVQAQTPAAGDWLVRLRALNLDSANKDSTGLDLSVSDKTFPEVDITYFFSPNWAAELVLTYPQEHDIRAGGTNIGSLKQIPPTLSLQYHVTGMSGWRPYAGIGLNYTRFSDVQFDPAIVTALQPTIKKDSYGLAVGVGVDVPLGGWLLNLDVKKVRLETDISSFGAKVGTFKVDPVLFSVGIGKVF